jgi:hypothetical protein
MNRLRVFDFLGTETTTAPIAWLILLAGGWWFANAADDYSAVVEENEQLVRKIDQLQRRVKLASAAVAVDAAGEPTPSLRHKNESFPWDLVLREIELAADRSVALRSLDTDGGQRRTRIVAETRSIDDALAFVGRLRATPLADKVLLLSHEMKRDAAVQIVGFSLRIDWNVE